jgi:hypothetical protein
MAAAAAAAPRSLVSPDYAGSSAGACSTEAILGFVASFHGVLPGHRLEQIKNKLGELKLQLECESRLRATVAELLEGNPHPFVLDIDAGFPYEAAWAVSDDVNASGSRRCASNSQTRELAFFTFDYCPLPVPRFRADREGKKAACY